MNPKLTPVNFYLNTYGCKIYGDAFSLYEFQLGLMKEFLQVSYRFDTIPANKRALALLAANECMLKANENAPVSK